LFLVDDLFPAKITQSLFCVGWQRHDCCPVMSLVRDCFPPKAFSSQITG
jgi:hypothetical protein